MCQNTKLMYKCIYMYIYEFNNVLYNICIVCIIYIHIYIYILHKLLMYYKGVMYVLCITYMLSK